MSILRQGILRPPRTHPGRRSRDLHHRTLRAVARGCRATPDLQSRGESAQSRAALRPARLSPAPFPDLRPLQLSLLRGSLASGDHDPSPGRGTDDRGSGDLRPLSRAATALERGMTAGSRRRAERPAGEADQTGPSESRRRRALRVPVSAIRRRRRRDRQ